MNDQYFGNINNPSDNVEGIGKDTNPDEQVDPFISDIPAHDAALNEEMQLEENVAGNVLVDEPLSEEVLMGRSFDDTNQPVVEEPKTLVGAALDKVEELFPTSASPAVSMAGPSAALFDREESEHFRTRWSEIQGNFVDEPRAAVLQADALVTEVIEHLTTMFDSEHRSLEGQWNQGSDVSTEDLRKALQRYRSFFNRLVV